MRHGINRKTVLSEVLRDVYIGEEANERKVKRQKKDLQEVIKHDNGDKIVLNG